MRIEKYRFAYLLVLLVSLAANAFAQDGKLVQRIPQDIKAELEKSDQAKAESPYLQEVTVEEITYLSDGLRVKGYLVYPNNQDKEYPCIIYNRGGNQEFGAITPRKVRLLAQIASWGYVVVGSQYRGNMGGEGREEFGGADVHDVLNLVPMLGSLPMADTSRIGIFGWSRGGMMTYLTLAQSCRFKAAVVGGGLSDLFLMKESRPVMEEVYEELIPDYDNHKDSLLTLRSAIHWPDKICKTTPILMLHGTADWRVVPKSATDLADAFIDVRQPFRLILLEGGDHGLNEFDDEVFGGAEAWLNYYVRDGGALPNLEPHGR